VVVLVVAGLYPGEIQAQLPGSDLRYFSDNHRFIPSPATYRLEPYLSLTGTWLLGETLEPTEVPFCTEGLAPLVLKKDFFLPQRPDDTLYIYFEGLAWDSEVYLNNRLLRLHDDPFRPLVIPVPPVLFNPQWNELRVRLTFDAAVRPGNRLVPFLGIHKPAFILQRADAPLLYAFPSLSQADTALALAAHSPEYLYNLPSAEAQSWAADIRRRGFRVVYLPFTPRQRLYQVFDQVGLELQVRRPAVLAWWNRPPLVRSPPEPVLNPQDSTLTPARVVWQSPQARPPVFGTAVLVTLLLLGLLALVGWKLRDSRSFADILALFRLGIKRYDAAHPHYYTNRGLLLQVLAGLRVLAWAFAVTTLCLLSASGLASGSMPVPAAGSWLGRWLDPLLASPWGLLAFWFFLLFSWELVRLAVISIPALAFRHTDWTVRFRALTILSDFPWLLLLCTWALWLQLTVASGADVPAFSVAGLAGLALALRAWGLFSLLTGFNTVARWPMSAILLYFCVLEVLPWLLLLQA
jgi:hypothetical protein